MANRKSTTGFPTIYRWNVYVTPKFPQKVAQKAIAFLKNKIQLQSNKASLCENFQRQGCNITIPLSNGPWILARNVTLQPKI